MNERYSPDSRNKNKSATPAALSAGAPNNAGTSLVDNRSVAVAQLTKKHHNPEKKKYLAKGVGKTQNAVAAAALVIKKASPAPISNKEAERMAKAQMKNK